MLDTKTLIAELSPEALHKMADQYNSVSNDLRAAAKSKAAALSRETANQAHRRKLENIPALVAGYQAQGMTADAAIRAAGIAAGVEAETVLAWLRHERREKQDRAREAKKARALDLASQGAGVREIAAMVHLPRSTVARLVTKSREEQSAARPAKLLPPPGGGDTRREDWATAATA